MNDLGAIHFSLDPALIAALRRNLPLTIFFETRTFEAQTTKLAAANFDRVLTVELAATLYERAVQTLSGYPHVEVINDSSPAALRARCPQFHSASVLYWLDAHWRGGVTAGVETECPVLAELGAIGSLNSQSVVLIDDARFFLAPPPAPHNAARWPRLDEIDSALRQISGSHALWVINDVLIYAPAAIAEDVIEYGRSCGIDLAAIYARARANSSVSGVLRRGWRRVLRRVRGDNSERPAEPAQGSATGIDAVFKKGFNRALLNQDRSEKIFAFHAKRLAVSRLLDIGSNSGQFAGKMRHLGFEGVIHSIEPQALAHAELQRNSENDVRWVPLPRQALGRDRAYLDLNIADNSWSSSFLPVHANHLRAAPQTRTVSQQRVVVTRSSDVLQAHIMALVDAVKIDVQGFEMEVLEGLRSYIGGVRILLLEMSIVECYIGAPDMFALDRFVVEELGFRRISLEPSYYDDTNGVVQQYDGIYVRDPPPVATLPGQPVAPRIGALYTSMNGVPARTGPDGRDCGERWLGLCVASWNQVSARVVSVSESAPYSASVEWMPRTSRPSIIEMFDAMHGGNAADHAILCNADIQVVADNLETLRQSLDPQTVYLAQREEVEFSSADADSLVPRSIYQLGFDLFIMPAEFVRFVATSKALPVVFRVGEPWWDYLLPLVALAAGFPVKRLPIRTMVARHYVHAARYDKAMWLERGQQFLAAIAAMNSRPDCRAAALFDEISALGGPAKDVLHAASRLVCNGLP